MKRYKVVLIVNVLFNFLIFSAAAAFPGVPYDGQAEATGVDVAIQIPLVAAPIEIAISSQTGTLAGAAHTPVSTGGAGEGINVTVPLGIPGGIIDLDIVNATASKAYDGDDTAVTDTDFVLSVSGPLINSGLVSATTTAQTTNAIAHTDGTAYILNATVGDALGGINILSAEAITASVVVETTTDHKLQSTAASTLAGVSVDIPLSVLTVNILTADLITASASTQNNGALPDATANSNVAFVNLAVAGVPIPTITPGTIMTVTAGFIPVNVARITLVPTTMTNVSATSSTASATALLIEVLAGNLVGTRIELGRTMAAANAASNTPTGPTAVHLTHFQANSPSHWTVFGLATFLLLIFTAFIWRKRRNC